MNEIKLTGRWKSASQDPRVKRGDCTEFIVACRRAHAPDKFFVFAAYYANEYADDSEDEDATTRTGWYMQAMDMSGEFAYVYEAVCNQGDEIVAWQPLPKLRIES